MKNSELKRREFIKGASLFGLSAGAGGVSGKSGTGAVAREARVDGTIDACGRDAVGSHTASGAAGGSILIKCATFAGSESGVLTAEGGDSQSNPQVGAGSGAGGSIAVWTGMNNFVTGYSERNLRRWQGEELPTAYLGTVSVTNGIPMFEGAESVARLECYGSPGTLRCVPIHRRRGIQILLR